MDDIKALLEGKNEAVVEMAQNVMKKLKRGGRKERAHIVSHRKW